MALECTHRRMASSGNGHEHIAYLWWRDGARSDAWTREQMVAYIEQNGDNSVWCPDSRNPGKPGQWVHVNSTGRTKYVQTIADGRWSDNLLALPTA
jgi:hypothetical protein